MKKTTRLKFASLTILCMALFFSCEEQSNESTTNTEVEMTANEPEISDDDFMALWEKIDALWEQRITDSVHTVYADNFTRISPGGKSTNKEELAREFEAINAAYPDMTLELERYDIRGDMIIVHWSADGTFTGEMAGVKGNGASFQDDIGVSIVTIKDGKIVKDDSYWDTFAIFADAGYSICEPS